MSSINSFWRSKYFRESGKSWDKFYIRNATNFFKDRHWTTREFPELNVTQGTVLLEVGCGVGNFAIPLLEENLFLTIYCFDISPTAIGLIRQMELDESIKYRLHPFVGDLTRPESIFPNLPLQVDLVSMIFIFSALEPSLHLQGLKTLSSVCDAFNIADFSYSVLS